MQTFAALQQPPEIAELLRTSTTIAIVGLSPKADRPSNMVGRYLLAAGYTIYPINPGHKMILGEVCYPDLNSLPASVDIVDIFRKSEEVLPIIEQIVASNRLPKAIWMQQGIVHEAAAQLARSKGIFVVMDRCIKIDHASLIHR
jgi:hypothetical protein